MAKTKEKSDLIINQGKHLTTCLNNRTGEFKMVWDWDALVHDVKAAILAHESKQELKAGKAEKKAKINLIKETEAKVAKTRAKKAEEKVSPAKAKATTKKAPAKKPAAKKKAATKTTK